MNGAQQSGSTTTAQAPWAPLQPYIGTAAGQAGNLLQTGGPQVYGGPTVAGFNPVQNQAFKGTLGMDKNLMMGIGQNPYERQMYGDASNAMVNQMQSQF